MSPVTQGPVEYWTTNSTTLIDMVSQLDYVQGRIDTELLLYKTPQNVYEPSNVYKYVDMIQSLMVMSIDGVAGNTFFVGPEPTTTNPQQQDGHIYGLVNLAAFLAQSMSKFFFPLCVFTATPNGFMLINVPSSYFFSFSKIVSSS